ncbi:MAG: ATP-binding protein [Actinomycetia bacterium]|nr:ATP-binding protein [Actinomycetes bacterium]
MERPPGHLFIGEKIDATSGDRTGDPVLLDSADFTTHGVIVGMTGSGKTGLGVVLIEEALMAGIPVLAIDPKGDLGNLCLTFPDLQAGDFEPWIDEGSARVQQQTVAEMAQQTAELWTKGLTSWELGSGDISTLQEAATPVIYTPGSTAGVPLDVMGRLSAPATDDAATRQDEIDSTVSGLLALVDIESDPLSGREHILLANLIARAWEGGTSLDLATLLGQILDPPMRKLGVLDLDTFYPPDDRQSLVLKLNGLLASPSFTSWAQGAPLDIEKMLWTDNGKARAAVVSIAHLGEAERQFAVTLVLGKLISWMRTKAGTGELRVLVYIDEVMGLAPPVANPPTKKPILTLLKQARAFGVGLVLSTQNPVDLDYKAISNAGTWLIGRLQTEQDKERLIDGLRSADGSVDTAAIEATISSLDKRQFVLRTTSSSELPVLTTRWAMSYLAGPLTGDQITDLMGDASAEIEASSVTTKPASAPARAGQPPTPLLGDNESTVPPQLPDSLTVLYATASAPWLGEVGASPEPAPLQAFLAARVELLFDETKAKLRHRQDWEAIVAVTADGIDTEGAVAVDFDDRDFVSQAPTAAVYTLPPIDLRASTIRSAKADLKAKLYRDTTYSLLHNAELKLWSRPGEKPEAFAVRCETAADDGADEDAGKLRDKLERKRASIEKALAKAEDRVNELEVQVQGRRQQELVDVGSSILGGLLGGRGRARKLASAARRAASGRRQTSATSARLDSARSRVGEKIDELEDLELDLAEALMEIDDEWSAKAVGVEEVEVPLEKSDISVEDFSLVWLPIPS